MAWETISHAIAEGSDELLHGAREADRRSRLGNRRRSLSWRAVAAASQIPAR